MSMFYSVQTHKCYVCITCYFISIIYFYKIYFILYCRGGNIYVSVLNETVVLSHLFFLMKINIHVGQRYINLILRKFSAYI